MRCKPAWARNESCLTAWAKDTGLAFTHVLIEKKAAGSGLLASLRKSGDYELVYENASVADLRTQDPGAKRLTNRSRRHHTSASIIKARKMKARYMLDQRYILHATLLPGTLHTCQAAAIKRAPRTTAETR